MNSPDKLMSEGKLEWELLASFPTLQIVVASCTYLKLVWFYVHAVLLISSGGATFNVVGQMPLALRWWGRGAEQMWIASRKGKQCERSSACSKMRHRGSWGGSGGRVTQGLGRRHQGWWSEDLNPGQRILQARICEFQYSYSKSVVASLCQIFRARVK